MTARSGKGSGRSGTLRFWVALGIAVTTGVGLVVLLLFARLQAGEWIWTEGFYLTGSQWFDAARTTVTLIGIIGLGGAAFLAYRKQLSTEAAHVLAEKGAVLAETSALRSRYTTCAEQLGNDSPAIRQAGVYALASLADDWHTYGNNNERQVCVDLLCAYVRTERLTSAIGAGGAGRARPARGTVAGRRPPRLTPSPAAPPKVDPQEQEVRTAIIGVIRERRNRTISESETDWTTCNVNLRGANLRGADLFRVNLTGADLTGANLTDIRYDAETRWPEGFTPPR